LVIRSCKVANWCPLTCYRLLKEQSAARGALNTLWCTEQGKPYKQAAVISRELKGLLVEAGLDKSVPAYCARHALITFLLRLGFSEVEVNAHTGHSNNSHTALNHYFHLDGNWAGRRIVEEAVKGVPEKAERVIEEDNKVERVEEGEEVEEGAAEGAVPAQGEERRGAVEGRTAPGKRQAERGKGGGGADRAGIGVRMVEELVRASTQSSDGRREGGGPAGNAMGTPAAPSDWGSIKEAREGVLCMVGPWSRVRGG
jgi:hypothetical protein